MIYITSDWHIGHDKPFIYESRGFSSIKEHDTAILERCNEIVERADELWILGDLAMGIDTEEWDRVFKNLTCEYVYFLIGNHETDKRMDKFEYDYGFNFEGYATVKRISKSKAFYLSHYPTIVSNYNEKNRFFWNLSGHTHSKEKINGDFKIYNVALDAHNCYPVPLETIVDDILMYMGGRK